MFKYVFVFLISGFACAQKIANTPQVTNAFSAELLWGDTLAPSDTFPELSATKGMFIHFGNLNRHNTQEWAYRLRQPTTGISVGYVNFGNKDKVGYAVTAMPYLEFSLFGSKRFKGFVGMGASTISEKSNSKTNPFNDAISTDLKWAFRLFFSYTLIKSNYLLWKIGGGYLHHSNGHSKLPNLGLNSILASTTLELHYNNFKAVTLVDSPKDFSSTRQDYLQFRSGYGQNVLSKDFNTKRDVYSAAISTGRIYNRTWKIGLGAYARYYEHYYRYISNEERLIRDEYPELKDNPFLNSMAFGVFGSAEVLLNHVGLEWQLGFNIFKPAYKIDRQEGQAFTFQSVNSSGPVEIFGYGELDKDYRRKQYMSNRFGLKYYLKGTNESPKWNLFLGATINANAGQADFNELSLGLVYRNELRPKKG